MATGSGGATQTQSQTAASSSSATRSSVPDDPVSKVKASIPLLRESVSSLFEQASIVVQLQSSGEPLQVDTTDGKLTLEQQNLKFAKALEEFYHMCDALETNIMLARATVVQSQESHKFTSKPDSKLSESHVLQQNYSDYLSAVRSQVTATKELHDLLKDFSQSLNQ